MSSIATTSICGGAVSVAADTKPRIDGVELELAKDVRPVGDEAEAGGGQADAEEQRHLKPASPARSFRAHHYVRDPSIPQGFVRKPATPG